MIQQIITKTAKENLNAVSALNARTAEKFVAAFQEVTESMAAEIESVPPYMRGMTAEAFARSYLSVNDTAQSVWIEFEENEAYGGLKAADPFASLYQVPKEYNGFMDIYVYREDLKIIESTAYDSDYLSYAYYNNTKAKNKPYVTPPYVDDYTKMIVSSATTPIHDANGAFIGCVGIDFDSVSLSALDFQKGSFETSYSYIISNEGIMISHSNADNLIGQDVAVLGSQDDFILSETPVDLGEETEPWKAVTALSKAELSQKAAAAAGASTLISTIMQFVLALILYKIIKRYLKPIGIIEAGAVEIAQGNLSAEINHTSDDELGRLSTTFRNMSGMLKLYINEISRVLNGISNLDLTQEIDEAYIGDFAQIKVSLEKIQEELSSSMHQISVVADEVSSSSRRLSEGAQILAQGAVKQTGDTEELISLMKQVSHLAEGNENNAREAHEVSQVTVSSINTCNREMDQMLAAMSEISIQSNEISQIIKAIEDIAFQTNMLAINAAVEAARAGQAGKGFSVVASEVRSLANKSAEAAKNTTQLIGRSAGSVQQGMTIANKTAAALSEITQNTSETSRKIDEILENTQQQKVTFLNILNHVEEISEVVCTNSAASEEDAASAEQLSSQAAMLKTLVEHFKLKN